MNLPIFTADHWKASWILAQSLLFVTALMASVHAENPEAYEYWVGDHGATITHYDPGQASVVIVPAELEGHPVTEIGWEAFANCSEITRIDLPDGVTAIRSKAFSGCTSLRKISLPKSLTLIDEGVFLNCRELSKVTIPEGVTGIGSGAFLGSGLKSIWIPRSVATIGAHALARCPELRAIHVLPGNAVFASHDGVLFDVARTTLLRYPEGRAGAYAVPEGVTTLSRLPGDEYAGWGDWFSHSLTVGAFEHCARLTGVKLPDSLLTIGPRSFEGCHALQTLTIPASVETIDPTALVDLPALGSYDVASDNPSYITSDGVLFDAAQSELLSFPQAKSGDYAVPATVTTLASGAFHDCRLLTGVELGEGITLLSDTQFSGCRALQRVLLPASLTEFPPTAFSDCGALEAIEVSGGSLHAIDGVLYKADRTELIFYPAGKSDSHLAIPEGVIRTGIGAFSGLPELASVSVPASMSELDYYALVRCPRLEAIKVAEGNLSFSDVDGVLYNAEKTTALICPRAWAGACRIPDGVTMVSWSAFADCRLLTSVTLPAGLEQIAGDAFQGCTALKTIDVPEGLTTIAYGAFRDCSSLEVITLPQSLTWLDMDALGNNAALEAIHVASGNENYSSIDGVLFNADGSVLIRYPEAAAGPYVVPDGVTRIRGQLYYGGFGGCGTGWGGWGYGWYYFNPYADVVRVGEDWVLQEDLDSSYEHDYYGNYGEGAFENSRNLTSLTIPAGVASIGERALAGSESLQEVRFAAEVPEYVAWDAFDGTSTDLVIHYAPTVHAVQPVDGGWQLTWSSIPTRSYVLEITPDLKTWTEAEPHPARGWESWGAAWNGRTVRTVVTPSDWKTCYFRVREVLP